MTERWGSTTSVYEPEPTRVVAPSVGPMVLAAVALAGSAALVLHQATYVVLVNLLRSELMASATGYILTPYVVVAALVWGRADGLGKQLDPWFDRARQRRQLQALQLAVMMSFALSVGHIVRIARWVEANLGSGI
jgi:hypothetical protein